MLRADDLAEAVKTGVITQEQAAALEGIATARHKARAFAVGREERFRLMGGFNDFFIAVGVVLLAIATGSFSAYAGLLVMWGLAEYLTGRLKLVAPSIVIVVSLAIFGAIAAGKFGDGTAVYAAAAAVAGLHYARFRLPFSLFVLASMAVGFVLSLIYVFLGKYLDPREATVAMQVASFVLGLGVFAWAMSFDVSDTERLTLRSDCGFWLHLIAAPLIVHSMTSPLMSHPLWPGARIAGETANVTGPGIAVAVLLVFALSAIALIIDRRALLVSGLGYLGSALAYTLSKIGGSEPASYIIPVLLFLGILIIVLGVGWRHIRATLMSSLSGDSWKRLVPPYGQVA